MAIEIEQRPPEIITVTCQLNRDDWLQISAVNVGSAFTMTMGSRKATEGMTVVVSRTDAPILVKHLESIIKYLEKHK